MTTTGAFAAQQDISFSESERALINAFGPWPPDNPADAGNELSGLQWAGALGKQLFHDKRLSGSGDLSCASCHKRELGFTDGRALARGAANHVRNTQGLLNVGQQYWFGWDGGTDSLWSAALRPLLSDVEMAGDIEQLATRLRANAHFVQTLRDGGHVDNAENAQGEALVVLAAKSIAAYTRTLVSGITPFDRFRDALANDDLSAQANYADAAKRGLKIFLGDANCHVCHFGPNFSNKEFHDTGRPFFTAVGQVDGGRYRGLKRVRADRYNLAGPYNAQRQPEAIRRLNTVTLGQVNFGQWRTPSLRNLTLTAPYTHDGSLTTLRDVVDAYADIDLGRLHSKGESVLRPLNLSEGDREDLVAFLRSLSVQ